VYNLEFEKAEAEFSYLPEIFPHIRRGNFFWE